MKICLKKERAGGEREGDRGRRRAEKYAWKKRDSEKELSLNGFLMQLITFSL